MEWFTTECGKYKIESLSAATFPGALDVIRKAHFQDGSVCIGTELNINPAAAEELLELCADAALDGSSLVAIHTTTNKVVAVAFNKLLEASTSEKSFFDIFVQEKCTQPSSRAYINCVIDLFKKCNIFEQYKEDCGLEIMFLSTLREHRRQNLATILWHYSVEVARKLKDGPVVTITVQDLGPIYCNMPPRTITTKYPKFCRAICTSVATQRIATNLKFTKHLRLSIGNYVYNGKSYLQRLGFDPYYEIVGLKLY